MNYGAPFTGAGGTTVDLSLISHTNAGKTTLARTMLGRDIGEVRDAAHVTDLASGHVLVQADGDALMLWDTPGFGDTARLVDRLRMSGNPIGWLLTQVWDRWRDRPLWSSQQAVKAARENADVILYLVNAAEDPAAAAYVDLEMEVLGWIGKPVLVLLNQMGPPRADNSADIAHWQRHFEGSTIVRSMLTLDAFARVWVQEGALLDAVAPILPAEKRAAMDRLAARWRALNEDRFEASMAALAGPLVAAARDNEKVGEGDWRDSLSATIGGGKADTRKVKTAMEALAERLAEGTHASTDALIALHGLDGRATRTVLKRIGDDYTHGGNTPEGFAALLGAMASGAATGLAADVMAGGLTLGGGMIVGGILGALGAGGLAKGINMARGEDGSAIRWSKELFRDLVGGALLRYLAVAHYGRGRGDWSESEHPDFWQVEVGAVAQAHAEAIGAIRTRARREPGYDAAADLTTLLQRMGRELLARLYPDARELLGMEDTALAPPPAAPLPAVSPSARDDRRSFLGDPRSMR